MNPDTEAGGAGPEPAAASAVVQNRLFAGDADADSASARIV
jgi:hypothetical protein